MKSRWMNVEMLNNFRQYLQEDEKSKATIEKYLRDMQHFWEYMMTLQADGVGKSEAFLVEKSLLLSYKLQLEKTHAVTSVNSMLASLNSFLKFVGWNDLCVKPYKIQRKIYCSQKEELTKAEYSALVQAAKDKNNERLSLVIQTICGTGIRVSELQFITVESLQKGEALVSCKGKNRKIFIVSALRKKLLHYTKKRNILSGPVFITRTGKPLNRSNIWREMKALCEQAGVLPEKVFPHNLRHLFARTFYGIEKDIAKLADILGHGSIETTRIYIMTTGNEHRRKMERLRLVV